jgi:Uma2 family endonuclease
MKRPPAPMLVGGAAPRVLRGMDVSAAPRRATFEDLDGVPDTLVGEIIAGELIVGPRPAARHALAATAIGSALFDRFDGPPGAPASPGGWCILFEPELHLGDDSLIPDVAGWRREWMPVVPDVAAFTMAPDWVCEVASPSTTAIDRARKMPIYAREGVGHHWLVDPNVHTLEAYRLDAGAWRVVRTFTGDTLVRPDPFAAVELDLRRWWA